MIEKTMSEFVSDVERLTLGAIKNDDTVKIQTSAGNAILISEAEWNIHVEAMKIILASNSH